MPKFVPRQRKHKVLARLQNEGKQSGSIADTNVAELDPNDLRKAREERKRQLKEQLLQEGPKVSSKKAKRLDKYIENKLKRDENRELLEKLAKSKTDTSLFASSKKLGQGRETKRERLSRALRDARAGIDVEGDNENVLFEQRPAKQLETPSSDDEDVEPTPHPVTAPQSNDPPPDATVGSGLKRPLELGEDGRPVIKKRKRTGGIKARLPPKATEQPQELDWEGFSSDDEERDDQQLSDDSPDHSDALDSEENSQTDSDSELDSEESSDESSDEDASDIEDAEKKERSSAFKSWANEQLNEALGYQPAGVSTVQEIPTIENFTPRAPEVEPLPRELEPTIAMARKVYSVPIERSVDIQNARMELPVVAEEQKIMEAIHNNNIVVVCGETGSGKTTQIPQFLFEAGYGYPGSPTPGQIGITQPRRVAAVSMAKRVGDELGEHGKHVAYQIRFEATVSADTSMKFMTDGVLLREVAQDIALRKYSAIIIDEAHERSVNTDILVGMMSRVVRLRAEMALEDPSLKPLKLIIMSATLRVTDFTENKTLFDLPPPVLQAEGRQHPVAVHFARKTHHDYVEEAFRKITRGHKKLPPGGMLVFLTGQNEIQQLSKRLKGASRGASNSSGPRVRLSGQDAPVEAEDIDFGEASDHDTDDESVDIVLDEDEGEFDLGEEDQEAGPAKMHILPLYSLLPTREQLRVFEAPPEGSRLIVLSTNVAETSLTIPGIRYVFDCGRAKERKYDTSTGVQSFAIDWISKASANQRSGRAGRTGPGHCYRLYSSAVYERDFPQFTEPEILRMPIEGLVLQLKAMNLQHVINFPFPTPPDRKSLAKAERLLTYLSALSPAGQINPIGATMSIFPLSPRFSRILLIGHLHDCLPYTVAMVAAMSAPDIFIPENQVIPATMEKDDEKGVYTNAEMIEDEEREKTRRKFNKVHKMFCFLDDKSDVIKLLQVVGEHAHEPTEEWCQQHYVRSKPLNEILHLRRQIADLLRINIPAFATFKHQDKLDPPSSKQVKALKQMVAAGFIDQVAIRADLAPNPPLFARKPKRAIDVPYLTLFPSHATEAARDTDDESSKAVYIHPSSPLAHVSIQECPQYIVYSALQRSTQSQPGKTPRTRMLALTDISGAQLATLAKGTPLLEYGKPVREEKGDGKNANQRTVWVIPYLRPDRASTGSGQGWPLPLTKIVQKKIPGRGWVTE